MAVSLGGGVPARGCTWSGGVGCTWLGGAPGPGVYLLRGGGSVPGLGVYLVWGGVPGLGGVPGQVLPPWTDTRL